MNSSTPKTTPNTPPSRNGDVAHRQGHARSANPWPDGAPEHAAWDSDWQFRHQHAPATAPDAPGNRLAPAEDTTPAGALLMAAARAQEALRDAFDGQILDGGGRLADPARQFAGLTAAARHIDDALTIVRHRGHTMTTPPETVARRLPHTLAVPGDAARAALLTATRTPGLQIVLGVHDTAQAVSHAGVILHDREMIGWITAIGIDGPDGAGPCLYALIFPGGRLDTSVYNTPGMPDGAAWIDEATDDDPRAARRQRWSCGTFLDLLRIAQVAVYRADAWGLDLIRRFDTVESVQYAPHL